MWTECIYDGSRTTLTWADMTWCRNWQPSRRQSLEWHLCWGVPDVVSATAHSQDAIEYQDHSGKCSLMLSLLRYSIPSVTDCLLLLSFGLVIYSIRIAHVCCNELDSTGLHCFRDGSGGRRLKMSSIKSSSPGLFIGAAWQEARQKWRASSAGTGPQISPIFRPRNPAEGQMIHDVSWWSYVTNHRSIWGLRLPSRTPLPGRCAVMAAHLRLWPWPFRACCVSLIDNLLWHVVALPVAMCLFDLISRLKGHQLFVRCPFLFKQFVCATHLYFADRRITLDECESWDAFNITGNRQISMGPGLHL